MLKPPKRYYNTSKYFSETAILAPGETPEARYAAWCLSLIAQPHFCQDHAHIQLVINEASHDISPVLKNSDPWSRDPESEVDPGKFKFRAELRCPVCCRKYANCPPEFHETNLRTFAADTEERTRVLACFREFVAWLKRQRCGMALLVGRPGTGKTRLACDAVGELDCRALYVRQGQITSALRASYGHKEVVLSRPRSRGEYDEEDEQAESPIDFLFDLPLLVLDEIGCTALANDDRLALDELIKHRYDHRKPTILISNLPLNELKVFLGDALADRINHATGNGKFIIQFSGQSFRRSTGEDYLAGLQGDRAASSDATAKPSPQPPPTNLGGPSQSDQVSSEPKAEKPADF
jgi:DNA replication protein DnaC